MSTYAEIQAKIQELTQQAEELRRSERADGIAQVRELMDQFGLTVEDLQAGPARRKSASVAAKYRNPETGKTWSGRGRTPTWLSDAEAAGQGRDQFLI